MVWNTTQSSLYRAVSDYNEEISKKECKPRIDEISDCSDSPKCDNQPLHNNKCDEQNTPQQSPNCCKKCAGCPKRRNPPNGNSQKLVGLNIDKDFLLLAGLILILSENGADKKLILALAFTLLG